MMRSEQELRELLPWYVNNTLDMATRRDIEMLVDRSPLARSEIFWLGQLRSQIQQVRSDAEQHSPSAGLEILMALVHGERSGKVMPLRSRLTVWLASPRRLSVPAGLAAAIVLTQAAIIGALFVSRAPESEQLSPLSGGTSVGAELLQVTFKPRATEVQIRNLLASVQGEIVSGPGVLGVYAVRVPDGQGRVTLARLRSNSSVIESAVLVSSR